MAEQTLFAVNQSDRDWTKQRFLLWFGEVSPKFLLVWANHLEDALDESIDCIAERWPGLLCDEQVTEQYKLALDEGLSEEKACEQAEQDTICAGNASHYIHCWHWGIVFENPSRQQLKEFLKG
jgi:hypothetical protein